MIFTGAGNLYGLILVFLIDVGRAHIYTASKWIGGARSASGLGEIIGAFRFLEGVLLFRRDAFV